ncbi:MAG: hypothetical protein V7629_14385 [Motiliproteus sp.]
MKSIKGDLASTATQQLSKLSARTWVIIGSVVATLLGVGIWAVFTLLSWIWGQVPAITETGMRLAADRGTQVEQTAAGLAAAGKNLGTDTLTQLDRVVPGLGAQLDPGRANASNNLPEQDVSGSDPQLFGRFPGLVRSHYRRLEHTVEVQYSGRVALPEVLAFYARAFAAEGFTQEVVGATAEHEEHLFSRNQQRYQLRLTRLPDGLLDVWIAAPRTLPSATSLERTGLTQQQFAQWNGPFVLRM